MTFGRRVAGAFAGAVLLVASLARAATPAEIEAAIRRGAAYLYTRQNAFGNWENEQKAPSNPSGGSPDSGQWGGRTALCTYALLAAGESALDAKIAKPVEFLRTADMHGNYALGLRANVWFYLPQTPANLTALNRDQFLLRDGVVRTRVNGGLYDLNATSDGGIGYLFDYVKNGGYRIDLSCSQYGVLGCWAAAQRLPPNSDTAAMRDRDFWERVEAAWLTNVNRDGGWSYNGLDSGNSTMPMTAAGVATLFITQELAHSNDDGAPRQQKNAASAARTIGDGLKWIGDHLKDELGDPGFYTLYGIERIGVASGYKYIGQTDWFAACADVLVKAQQADGSWQGQYTPEIDTSFALLFLSRGRSPVMVNKLAYKITAPRSGKEAESDWDRRPRDMANVARWVEDKTERRLNWQIVDLDVATLDDLHDANVLYVTTDRVISLKPEQKAKLKQYVEEGGLIVINADHGAKEVALSAHALGSELWPGLSFAPLDPKHVLLTGEEFPIGAQKHPVKVEALGNGAREFMLLVPNDDLSTTFQRRDVTRESAYQFFANVFLYSTEKVTTRFKGQTYIVRVDPAIQTTADVTIARVKYDGGWDPEPAGWSRLAAVLHNDAKVNLKAVPWTPGEPVPDGCRIAHLTGTAPIKFTDAQRAGLKAFVDGGGLLLIDACGGNPAFDVSVRAELDKMYPDAAVQLVSPLPPGASVFQRADGKAITPDYRTFALPTLGPLAKTFQLRGVTIKGKLGVLLSDQDLSVGWVGQPVDGIVGYTPEVATALVRRIVELTMADAAKTDTPATQPAAP